EAEVGERAGDGLQQTCLAAQPGFGERGFQVKFDRVVVIPCCSAYDFTSAPSASAATRRAVAIGSAKIAAMVSGIPSTCAPGSWMRMRTGVASAWAPASAVRAGSGAAMTA